MKVSMQLSGTPDWVHPDAKSSEPDFFKRIWSPPRGSTELSHWSNYVTDVVTRYKGRVQRFEMWNEPNLPEYWRPGPSPKEYAPLLKAGYDAAKAADPNSTVVFAGLSRNHVGYLETFYREVDALYGASTAAQSDYYFDVLGVHPYSDERSPDTNSTSYTGQTPFGLIDRNFLGLKRMKATMDQKGDTGKNIWVGEMGYSTTQTWMQAVPDETRAQYLEQAYTLARGLGYVEGMNWYYYRASSADGQEWSIVGPDFTPTKTFEALRRTTSGETAPSGVRVDSLSTDGSAYFAGETVRTRATLSAASEGVIEQAVIAVRPKGGDQNFDFSPMSGVDIGPASPATLTGEKVFSAPGTYQYFAAYYDGSAWVNLSPVKEFTVKADARPEILYPKPAPGSVTRYRRPAITAVVRDARDELGPSNVKLFLDGRRVYPSYVSSTDRLTYVPRTALALGYHRVTIYATDGHGLSTSRAWSFRIVR